ncbi:GNAT family N-acetyltransferase [Natronomonas sp. EA1]|uniref:GNAT family N-acetyltransferase n=1 Tax=Natronomonas sp. EA1 TaxID=3421655 RepID=UPI003EBC2480
MPGPIFRRGEHVDLRTEEEEDVEFLQRLSNDPRIRWGLTTNAPQNGHAAEQAFERHSENTDEAVGLVISPAGESRAVGKVVVFDIDDAHGTAELACYVDPDEQGNGYGSAGTELMVEYAFAERRLHKLRARAIAPNDASQATLESIGFTQEGIQRDEKFVQGEHVDVVLYGLLASEWGDR